MPLDGTSYEPAPVGDVATLLDRARQLLERGWVAGTQKLGDKYCAVGAIHQAAVDLGFSPHFNQDGVLFHPLCKAAAIAVYRAVGLSNDTNRPAHEVAYWNNKHDQATVVAGFKKAVALASQEAALAA